MSKRSKEGMIRGRQTGFLKKVSHPLNLRDITVNNINLYKEMQELNSSGHEVYNKYEQIIEELMTYIKDMEQ